MAQGSSGLGSSLAIGYMVGMLLVTVLAVAWPIRAVRRWQGGWRIAAMVPLAMMGFVVLRWMQGVREE